jgi:hypothetical protein
MHTRLIRRAHGARSIVALLILGMLAACQGERATAPPIDPSTATASRGGEDGEGDNHSRPDATAEETIVVKWSSACLVAVRSAKPGPPMVARMLAIVHTAMYDAWAAYDARAIGTRLGGSLRRPGTERTLENKRKAMSYAAYRALGDLFPRSRYPLENAAFDRIMADLHYDPADVTVDPRTAAGVGNAAAAALLDYRHRDGSNQLGDRDPSGTPYGDYAPKYVYTNTVDKLNDPTRWQPLLVTNAAGISVAQTFVAPHWYRVTPFAMTSGSQFRMPGLKPNQPFGGLDRAIDELISLSANLTDRQKVIAEYWADGPNSELPPGHWCLFAALVSKRDHHSEDDDAKMFFAVANAGMDAGIAAWDLKRYFDTVRPVTAIPYYRKDKWISAWGGPGRGTVRMLGQNWRPYQPTTFPTPPFPEFISGHSTFSAASAEVLRRFTGSDRFGATVTIKAGSSTIEPGLVPAKDVTLSWKTFSDAADEAGLSRRYGGIHFTHGDLQGRLIGRMIGAQTWRKAEGYFEGKVR